MFFCPSSWSTRMIPFLFFLSTAINHPRALSDPSGSQSHQPPVLRFSSPKAQQFAVPRKLPQMDFEIDPSYAGLIDISKSRDQTVQLFFWFIPASTALGVNHLTLWSNGGPGCSSMIGAVQENGPIMWDPGRTRGRKNFNSWHQSSSMLYVDHPPGVGYSQGNVKTYNEYQVADYLCRFLIAWLQVFPEMSYKKFYLAGESYAGMYLSYTAATIHSTKYQIPLSLTGVFLIDAVFSDTLLQEQVPLFTFVEKNKNIFHFNSSFMEKLNKTDKACGYSQYLQKHLVYPPNGTLPDLTLATSKENPKVVRPQCNIVTMMNLALPPGFSTYNILWRKAFDYALDSFLTYFDLMDVKRAFNIESEKKWQACLSTNADLFPNGDQSPPPALSVLPDVIKKNNITILASGNLDSVLFTDGARISLQNLTWNEGLGFTKPIDKTFSVDGKPIGKYNFERGLMFIEVDDSGHKLPHDQQEASLRIFNYLLGHRQSLSN